MEKEYLEEFLPINGKRQYLLHYPSKKKDAPVILFVHGGPGAAASLYAHSFQENLQEYCTMVYWDMPGAGKTLTENPDFFPTIDQVLRDLFVVVSCLKIKYWKQKIILLGHSFGSIVSALYAMKHPMDLCCFIGCCQAVGIMENEQAALPLLKEKIQESGNRQDLQKLENLGEYPLRDPKAMIKKAAKVRKLQGKYGIGLNSKQMLSAMVKSPVFHQSDLNASMRGLKKNLPLWEFMVNHSLQMEMHPYKMPVYFILGEQDCQAPVSLALEYMDRLKAPEKQVITVPDSGHFPMLQNPTGFREALLAVLQKLS